MSLIRNMYVENDFDGVLLELRKNVYNIIFEVSDNLLII